jgi:hypothetical protein
MVLPLDEAFKRAVCAGPERLLAGVALAAAGQSKGTVYSCIFPIRHAWRRVTVGIGSAKENNSAGLGRDKH